MNFVQNLWKRAEGSEHVKHYDSVISRIRCVHTGTPPRGETFAPLLSCSFAKKPNNGHVLASTCEDGNVILVNTASLVEDNYAYNVQQINSNALFSVAWSDVDMKLVVTSGDHNAFLLDAQKDSTLTELNSFKAHLCSVKTASFRPHSADVFATGSRDGAIYVWDARHGNSSPDGVTPDQCIMNGHRKLDKRDKSAKINESTPSITCVTFQDEYRLVSCADADPCVKVWDLRKTYMQHMNKPLPAFQITPNNQLSTGYSHMVINRSGTRLFANNRNSTIYCYNLSSYGAELEHTYTGYQSRSFYIKCSLSPDEQYLTSTDTDNKVFIWRVNHSESPIVMLDGSPDGLSDVAWCPEDELKLATSSDNPSPWIWGALPNLDYTPCGDKHPGFAVELSNLSRRETRRPPSTMSINLTKYSSDEDTEFSKISLPNAVIDGIYQTHMCRKLEVKPSSPVNWLTNLHHRQAKSVSPKVVRRLSVRNRVPSPKVIKSPSTQTKRPRVLKRKRLIPSTGNRSNDLMKYFKSSDENRYRV